ncbi:MAG: hypothetical protein JL50_06190 [Peptococcaceae bacterium BICA1-7]|nr:MAG: hypothetical protein JL50_06190 [Peptococcaceae bacterium BICA1-7]HBV96184.1 hypothetical protein [Desulfotomaculum sp.]
MNQDNNQISQKIIELLESNTPIILFVGKSYGDLSPILAKQPWSCIITSTTYEGFAYNFEIVDKRIPIPISNYEDMLDKVVLNQRELNVIYLHGKSSKSEEALSFREAQQQKLQAEKMVTLIPELLKGNFGSLVIVGYDPDIPDEVDISVLYNVILQMRKGSAFLFGASDSLQNSPFIRDLVQHNQLQAFADDLSNLMEDNEASKVFGDGYEISYSLLQDEDSDALYINKKRTTISYKSLLDTRGFVRLLSESEVGDTSYPPHMKIEYFYSFLKDSVRRPVWFGYENNFNLCRNFEPSLEKAVRSALSSGKETAEQKSILLVGQTSSSKTIALGALAYKIYREREYPVLFINNPDINLEQNSPNFVGLDMLLKKLEDLDAHKVLLIWDNSSSISQIQESRKLYTALINRGRRVVLVSTAYEQPESYYKSFITIKADINLHPEELDVLQDKIVDLCDISAEDFKRWVKQNNERNLLTLLYTFLYSHLHTEISQGLQQEIDWGMDKLYIRLTKQLSAEEGKYLSDIALALQNAGYTLSDLSEEDDSSDRNEKVFQGIQNFCNSVATSYQVKIPLPLSMALRCMNLPMDNRFSGVQNALLNVPFLQIISPELDGTGFDYLVAFRTPLEAEIYLESAGITQEKQIDYIVSMICELSSSGEYNKHSEAATIERLIRIIGPNCTYPEQKHRNYFYKPYYHRIIDALTHLRVNKRINEPRLICQEVAWLREVYGTSRSIGEFTVKERREKLQQAIDISRGTIENMENPRLSKINKVTKNNLIVESALSQLKLHDLRKENANLEIKEPSAIFDFREIFQQLNKVIASDPTNTYPYNALLRLFRAVYYSDTVTEENKIRYLSNVTSVIDEVESQGREVEDNEEYQENKAEILSFLSEEKYKKYYDDLLTKGSASGIHLKARKMLADAGIDYKKAIISIAQKAKAQEIVDFLKNNMVVAQNHAGCLYMLLSLTWLLYNEAPIFSGEEKQFTRMDVKQWREINRLCEMYEQQFLRGEEIPFNTPTMYYLLALSCAQLDNFQGSLNAFSKINETMFYTQIRTKVWHILCEKDGTPKKFKGTIDDRKYDPISKKGRIHIEKISDRRGVFFYGPNLHLIEIKGIRSDFEIGTSYMGFTAFRMLEERR